MALAAPSVQVKIVLAEILAVHGQLMMHQRGQHLLKLQEESFARLVTIWPHVKLNGESTSYLFHLTSYILHLHGFPNCSTMAFT